MATLGIKQIREGPLRIFSEENRRIVFWYDGERKFEEKLPSY